MSTNDRTPPPQRVLELSTRHLTAYRRAARRPNIRFQLDRLLDDLRRLGVPRGDDDPPLPVGAALAIARAALEFAITTATNDADRALKSHALRGMILPALDVVGHQHVSALVESALACDIDPPAVLRGSYARH